MSTPLPVSDDLSGKSRRSLKWNDFAAGCVGRLRAAARRIAHLAAVCGALFVALGIYGAESSQAAPVRRVNVTSEQLKQGADIVNVNRIRPSPPLRVRVKQLKWHWNGT